MNSVFWVKDELLDFLHDKLFFPFIRRGEGTEVLHTVLKQGTYIITDEVELNISNINNFFTKRFHLWKVDNVGCFMSLIMKMLLFD